MAHQVWGRDSDVRIGEVVTQFVFVPGPNPIVDAHNLARSSGATNGTTFFAMAGRITGTQPNTATSSLLIIHPWEGGPHVSVKMSRTIKARFQVFIDEGIRTGNFMIVGNVQVLGPRAFMARDACTVFGWWDPVNLQVVFPLPACNFGPHLLYPIPAATSPAPVAFGAPAPFQTHAAPSQASGASTPAASASYQAAAAPHASTSYQAAAAPHASVAPYQATASMNTPAAPPSAPAVSMSAPAAPAADLSSVLQLLAQFIAKGGATPEALGILKNLGDQNKHDDEDIAN